MAKEHKIDMLVFSPHPDDEILSCGGTMINALRQHKKVKVVFLTNGEAYVECAQYVFKKNNPGDVTPGNYITFGYQRQREAIKAAAKLGLKEKDIFFLSYPDQGLGELFSSLFSPVSDNDYGLCKSVTTRMTHSIFRRTFGRARFGYRARNIIEDIKTILRLHKPLKIFMPHPSLDFHLDHTAATMLISMALDEIDAEAGGECAWLKQARLSYYVIHKRNGVGAKPGYAEEVTEVMGLKKEALEEYATQVILLPKIFAWASLARQEVFYRAQNGKEAYLEAAYRQWQQRAKPLAECGCNVVFGLVADTADDRDRKRDALIRNRGIYSNQPEVVFRLIRKIAQVLNAAGIIPVAMHFPGLGAASYGFAGRLPIIRTSYQRLYEKDMFPFAMLIKEGVPFWIMTSHAIYKNIDHKPASLSYKIQTQLLRNKLKFKGIIISSELLQLCSYKGSAFTQKHLGEMAVLSFEAGTDIIQVFPHPKDLKKSISEIIAAVKKAVIEGRITDKEIDMSVGRILQDKERVYAKKLKHLLSEMSLEDKIAQKIIADTYQDCEILRTYALGGIYPRNNKIIAAARGIATIPLFIAR